MAFWWLCVTLLLAFPCGARMVGGPVEQSPDSPLVMDAARVAMTLYNEQANDKYFYALGKVISAKTQVVAGVIFYLEVEVGRCEKQNQQMTSCPQDSNTKTLLCDLSLWEQPWENSNKLLKSQCRDA
ncbi:cystatin-like [Paramormyrops kingsleyae]|uniref:cystatin-like n=1 Tax=Paramormyrops kingsleyae TaxID=1676925 RepID=UPI003B9746E0